MAEGEQVGSSLATETSGTGEAPAPATQSQPTAVPEWVTKLEGLDDSARSKLARYKTVNDVAKSALEFDKRISQSVVIPGKDATKQDWDAFHKRLGRPESMGEYEYDEVFLPEGLAQEDKLNEGFSKIAFELGLNKEQAKKLHKYAMDRALGGYGAMKKFVEANKETSRSKLRDEWKGEYDKNIATVGNLFRTFGSEEIISYMNSGPGNDPAMLKFLANVGKKIMPDTLERGQQIDASKEQDEGTRLFPNSPQMTGANRVRRVR